MAAKLLALVLLARHRLTQVRQAFIVSQPPETIWRDCRTQACWGRGLRRLRSIESDSTIVESGNVAETIGNEDRGQHQDIAPRQKGQRRSRTEQTSTDSSRRERSALKLTIF